MPAEAAAGTPPGPGPGAGLGGEEEEEEGGEGRLPPPVLLCHALPRRPLTSVGESAAGRSLPRTGSSDRLLPVFPSAGLCMKTTLCPLQPIQNLTQV